MTVATYANAFDDPIFDEATADKVYANAFDDPLFNEQPLQAVTQPPAQENVATEPTGGLSDSSKGHSWYSRAGSHFARGATEAIPSMVDLGAKAVGYIGKGVSALAREKTPISDKLTESDLRGLTHKAYDYVAEKAGLPAGEPKGILEQAAKYAGSGAVSGAAVGGALGGPAGAIAGAIPGAIGGAFGGAAVGVKRKFFGEPESFGGALGEAAIGITVDLAGRKIADIPKKIGTLFSATKHIGLKDIIKSEDFGRTHTARDATRALYDKAEEAAASNLNAKVDLADTRKYLKKMFDEAKRQGESDVASAYQELFYLSKEGDTVKVAGDVYARAKGHANRLSVNHPDIANTLGEARAKAYSSLCNSENKEVASAFTEAVKSYKTDKTIEWLNANIMNEAKTGVDPVKLSAVTADASTAPKGLFPSEESYNSFMKSGAMVRGLQTELEGKKASKLARLIPPSIGSLIGAFFGGKWGAGVGAAAGHFLSKPIIDKYLSSGSLVKRYLRLLEKDAPVSVIRKVEDRLAASLNALIQQAGEQNAN